MIAQIYKSFLRASRNRNSNRIQSCHHKSRTLSLFSTDLSSRDEPLSRKSFPFNSSRFVSGQYKHEIEQAKDDRRTSFLFQFVCDLLFQSAQREYFPY